MKRQKKAWGGRFAESTNRHVEEFTASIGFDRRLFRYDIEGSMAHCRMLAQQRIISRTDEKAILAGLRSILADMESGRFRYSEECEDIHMAIEQALIARAGHAGGKLHTGRSRNDQVSLDMRMYLRDETREILGCIAGLQSVIVGLAERHIDVIAPGYTHLQKAQPVSLAHYLLAWWEMLARDAARLQECLARINVMPLGSAALAGTGIPIDRTCTAKLLGFPAIAKNSMDAVSDRDFIVEFISDAAILMMHLSRLSEDIVIWASGEFGFIEIADAFTTGSSIMPQKKNPDVAELVRGKTGRVYGNLVALLTIMKGLPMTYNRDLQEDKEPLFDTVDTIKACLTVLTEMLGHTTFRADVLARAAGTGFTTATDMAEHLACKGVPFREAHRIVGAIVGYCVKEKKDLKSLSLPEIRRFYRDAGEDIYACMDAGRSVDMKVCAGGTSRRNVAARIREIARKKK
jgi:argininosuccinate lyase